MAWNTLQDETDLHKAVSSVVSTTLDYLSTGMMLELCISRQSIRYAEYSTTVSCNSAYMWTPYKSAKVGEGCPFENSTFNHKRASMSCLQWLDAHKANNWTMTYNKASNIQSLVLTAHTALWKASLVPRPSPSFPSLLVRWKAGRGLGTRLMKNNITLWAWCH